MPLNPDTAAPDEPTVRLCFEKFGTISKLNSFNSSNQPDIYYVEYYDSRDAVAAFKAMNGSVHNQCKFTIELAWDTATKYVRHAPPSSHPHPHGPLCKL